MTLDDITLKSFVDAIRSAIDAGHNKIAPLGMSGTNIYLHRKESRVQEVSIRLYCGDVELLITNESKNFLFYGRYDISLGVDFVANEYYRIFYLLKGEMPKTKEKREPLKVQDNPTYSEGFDMMRKYYGG